MILRKENDVLTKKDMDTASLCSSLGHPARVALVRYLLQKNCGRGVDNQTCNSDLVQMFPYSQSTLSQHVKVLREAGVFLTEEREKYVFYQVNPKYVSKLKVLLDL